MSYRLYYTGSITVPADRQRHAVAVLRDWPLDEVPQDVDMIAALKDDAGFDLASLIANNTFEVSGVTSAPSELPDRLTELAPFAVAEITVQDEEGGWSKWILTNGAFHEIDSLVTYPALDTLSRNVLPPFVSKDERTLTFTPNQTGYDQHRFSTDYNANYTGDPVKDMGFVDLPGLVESSHWEDRIRAQILMGRLKPTLPDQFPCIYETPDSPNHRGVLNPRPFAWVKSPDIDMLTELLPDYQRLWDSYTSQWGPNSRRTMAVGRLDGLAPHDVYRPGTTPAEVIGNTLLIHDGMYVRAPQELRAMHPRNREGAA